LAIGANRLELLLVELEEERRRVVQTFLLVVALAVLALMTLVVATFAIVFMLGEERRASVLLILVSLYALGALGTYWRLRRLMNREPAFSASLAEFKKDKAWVEEKS